MPVGVGRVHVAPPDVMLPQDVVEASGSLGAEGGILNQGCLRVQRGRDRENRRQLVELDPHQARSLLAASFVSAATMATGSPWYFVSPTARTGRSSSCGPKRGMGWGRSAAVITRRTPVTFSAADVSIEMILARAQSSVTSLASRTSGTRISATYSWRPVTRPKPPTRLGEVPMKRVLIGVPFCDGQDCVGDLEVAAAPAEVAGEALLDLVDTWMRIPGKESLRRHQLARGAEAALRGAFVQERLLERAELPVLREPSTVTISAPSASTASMRQESTIRPFTITVHAPHSPTRQHSLVPVSSRSSRRTSSSV